MQGAGLSSLIGSPDTGGRRRATGLSKLWTTAGPVDNSSGAVPAPAHVVPRRLQIRALDRPDGFRRQHPSVDLAHQRVATAATAHNALAGNPPAHLWRTRISERIAARRARPNGLGCAERARWGRGLRILWGRRRRARCVRPHGALSRPRRNSRNSTQRARRQPASSPVADANIRAHCSPTSASQRSRVRGTRSLGTWASNSLGPAPPSALCPAVHVALSRARRNSRNSTQRARRQPASSPVADANIRAHCGPTSASQQPQQHTTRSLGTWASNSLGPAPPSALCPAAHVALSRARRNSRNSTQRTRWGRGLRFLCGRRGAGAAEGVVRPSALRPAELVPMVSGARNALRGNEPPMPPSQTGADQRSTS